MCENEWIQDLQAVQPPPQDVRWVAPPPQDIRWHGAPSISPLPASMQHTLTMPPFQSHNATVRTQHSLFDAPRSSNSAQHHAPAHAHAHAWPPVPLHPDHSSMSAIGMMNYWLQEYIGTPYSYANNLMQYQNARHGGAFIQDFAAQHDNVGMLDVRPSTMHMQDTAGPYHNVSTSMNTEGASGDMQRVRMRENIVAQHQNETMSMNTELLASAPAPSHAGSHDLALQQIEGGAIRWGPYYHDRDMEKVQQGQVSANAHASGGAVMMITKEECGRPSVRLAERKVHHHSGKDRHSKVKTAKGMRDRRVRLSVSTAAQFYDIQDRLGFQQPSRVFEWLMQKAKHVIDQLPASPSGYRIMEDNDPDAAAPSASSDHQDTPLASLNHPHKSFKHLHTSVQDPSVAAPAAICVEDHHTNARLKMGSASHDPSSSSVHQ